MQRLPPRRPPRYTRYLLPHLQVVSGILLRRAVVASILLLDRRIVWLASCRVKVLARCGVILRTSSLVGLVSLHTQVSHISMQLASLKGWPPLECVPLTPSREHMPNSILTVQLLVEQIRNSHIKKANDWDRQGTPTTAGS